MLIQAIYITLSYLSQDYPQDPNKFSPLTTQFFPFFTSISGVSTHFLKFSLSHLLTISPLLMLFHSASFCYELFHILRKSNQLNFVIWFFITSFSLKLSQPWYIFSCAAHPSPFVPHTMHILLSMCYSPQQYQIFNYQMMLFLHLEKHFP